MKKMRPDVELIQAPVADPGCACNDCPYMKLSSLEKIERALQTLSPQVNLTEELRLKAKISLDRMMQISIDQPVQWPDRFQG